MAIQWIKGEKAGNTEFVGCVLRYYADSVQVMSDMWENCLAALVYSEACDKFFTINFGYGDATAEVDASLELIQKHEDLLTQQEKIRDLVWNTKAAKKQALQIMVGKDVEVIKGKKVPLGVYGVTWVGHSHYSDGLIVNLRDIKGNRYNFINAENCRVHNPEQHLDQTEEVACEGCKQAFIWGSDEVSMKEETIVCNKCYKVGQVEGVFDFPTPEGANLKGCAKKLPWIPGDNNGLATPGQLRSIEEDAIILHLLETDGKCQTSWLVYADYLEENQPEGETSVERATRIRVMLGAKKPRKKREKVS